MRAEPPSSAPSISDIIGGVGAKWAKIRPILTLMNFSKKQQCPVNVFLPLNMHHELSEQNKIAQFYSDEMSKLR